MTRVITCRVTSLNSFCRRDPWKVGNIVALEWRSEEEIKRDEPVKLIGKEIAEVHKDMMMVNSALNLQVL